MTTVGNTGAPREDRRAVDIDPSVFLHPALGFESPTDVLNDPDLTRNEKRSILASWASDACAIEANPALRQAPTGKPVSFDDIAEALRQLDRLPNAPLCRRLGRSSVFSRRSRAIWGHTSARRPEPPRPDDAA